MEFGSHFRAEANGWQFAISYAEYVAVNHAVMYHAVHGEGPHGLLLPWDPVEPIQTVTETELEALRASLKKRSAFRD